MSIFYEYHISRHDGEIISRAFNDCAHPGHAPIETGARA